ISLMNFSAQPSRWPFICCNDFSSFQSFLFFSSSAAKIPVLFGTAKVVIFLTLSSFLLKLFSFCFSCLKQIQHADNLTPFRLSNSLLNIAFTVSLPPKRDAKVAKNWQTQNLFINKIQLNS
uniref:hypothetical protein n=1 Tax=Pedobacter sp. TaxID=1411316 RepID=UPI003D7F2DCF